MDTLRGIVSIAFISVHTVLWCIPLYAMGLVRVGVPVGAVRRGLGGTMDRIIDGWVASNRALLWSLRLTKLDVRVQGDGGFQRESPQPGSARGLPLARDGWYLIVSNHQSWADILVLQDLFLGRVPPLKFFTKRELIWAPMVGVAMWLLGFPYVRRYGREVLEAHPELREHDRNATLRACERFLERPTSVLSFLEGTRFTPAKHAAQQSPHTWLLKPKSSGFAYVAEALDGRLSGMVDVTIDYPGGPPSFWDYLCGRCRRVDVTVASLGVPVAVAGVAESGGREALRSWIDDLWRAKDRELTILREGRDGTG